jgi:hypothetical protein
MRVAIQVSFAPSANLRSVAIVRRRLERLGRRLLATVRVPPHVCTCAGRKGASVPRDFCDAVQVSTSDSGLLGRPAPRRKRRRGKPLAAREKEAECKACQRPKAPNQGFLPGLDLILGGTRRRIARLSAADALLKADSLIPRRPAAATRATLGTRKPAPVFNFAQQTAVAVASIRMLAEFAGTIRRRRAPRQRQTRCIPQQIALAA